MYISLYNTSKAYSVFDPLMHRIDLEVQHFGVQVVVQIIIEAVHLAVEDGEDFRTTHEADKMREEIGIRV
jgi:hypothetical protein